MRKVSTYFIISLLPITSAMAVDFPKSTPPQPISKYGLIQNVQDYSSNPFWTPGSPYNQRMPVPVYAQGTDLTAADCQSVVASLVTSQCVGKNNCVGVQLSDIRPAILTQMSKMPGYNYVSACAGFVDGAFNDYVARYGNAVSGKTNFPTALAPGSNAGQPEFKIENPYAPKLPSWNGEEWAGGLVGRTVEMATLQAQNQGGAPKLVATQMPQTIADLSFEERMELTKEGYEQWAPVYGTNSKGERICIKNCAYQSLNIEKDETFWQREAALAAQRQMVTGKSKKNDDSCVDKLKELADAEAYIAKLRECKAKGLTFDQCMKVISTGEGSWGASESIVPGLTNTDLTTSAITGAGTVAAIVFAARNAAAIRAGATPVAPTVGTPGTPGIPAVAPTPGSPAVPAVPAVPGTNYTPVSGVNTAGGVTTGVINGRTVKWYPSNTGGGTWRYSNGSIASNAPITGLNTPGTPGSPAIPAIPGTPGSPAVAAVPGTPASTNIKQTWLGAREVQGANSTLRRGQVAGQGVGGASAMSKVGGALMIIGGTIGVAQSASGNEEHGWGNVLSGALSGASAGAGAGMALNVIPAYGQVAFGITVAASAVAGATIAGSQMFSETDCARDPFLQNADGTSVFTCCHTQFNKGQRWVDIGGDMTCGDKMNPGIRTCLNGGSSTGDSVWSDDVWSTECKIKYCDGWDVPETGTKAVFAPAAIAWDKKSELSGEPKVPEESILYHSGEMCWVWECQDGMQRQGGRCVPVNPPVAGPGATQPGQSIDELIAKLEARAAQIRKECKK